MALSKAIEKLKKYYARLDAGKTRKIKPGHVEKVMGKLSAKEGSLLAEIDSAKKESKKKRLKQKLAITREQMQKAQWLMEKIS